MAERMLSYKPHTHTPHTPHTEENKNDENTDDKIRLKNSKKKLYLISSHKKSAIVSLSPILSPKKSFFCLGVITSADTII